MTSSPAIASSNIGRKVGMLLSQPAFRRAPMTVIGRGVRLAIHLGLRREPVVRLSSGGERLRVPADLRYTTLTTVLLRDWSEPELRELHQLLGPGETFVDVGANVGLYSLKAASLVGAAGVVVAVEPGAEAFSRLRSNIALNAFPQVKPVQTALYETDGEMQLHHVALGNDPQAYSLIPNASAASGETVRVQRLDSLVADLGLRRLDLIKIDVEGAEPMVLKGGVESLRRFHPAIIFECNVHKIEGESRNTQEAWQLLQSLGYGFRRLMGDRFEPITAPPAEICNIVAVHPAGRQVAPTV